MTANYVQAFKAQLSISTDLLTPSYSNVGQVTSYTLDIKGNTTDVTTFDDDGNIAEVVTSIKATIKGDMVFNLHDTVLNHQTMMELMLSKSKFLLKLVPDDAQAGEYVESDAYLTSFSIDAKLNEVIKASFEISCGSDFALVV